MEVNIGQGATEVPIGFGLGLAMNEQAMAHYSQMTEEERQTWHVIAGQVKSRAEMTSLVDQLGRSF